MYFLQIHEISWNFHLNTIEATRHLNNLIHFYHLSQSNPSPENNLFYPVIYEIVMTSQQNLVDGQEIRYFHFLVCNPSARRSAQV